MTERIPQSVAKRVPFKAFLAADHVTPAGAGLTIPVQVSKNGGEFADLATPANATSIGSGWYYVDLAVADTGTLGPLIVRGTEVTIDPAEIVYQVVPATNAGFSSTPNAAADAPGGLPISDAGGLDMDSLVPTGAADPLLNAVPGTYGAGTAGYYLGHLPSSTPINQKFIVVEQRTT
jgi:hypothetical protein